MSSSSTSNPPLPSDLPSLLKSRYEAALASGAAFFYPSEIHSVRDKPEETQIQLQWSIRRCEALREKAREKKRKEEEAKGKSETAEASSTATKSTQKGGQNPDDVFAPPYDQNLLIAELGDHTLLLNKFALIPEHFLLVTREFRSQALPPSPPTLALSYRILTSLPSERPNQRLCFFNCGPDSGASQPHCHMQFVDLKEGGGVLIEEMLDRIPRDGKEETTVHALPLPYQHYVHLLPPSLPSADPDTIESTMAMKLLTLLDAMFTASQVASQGDASTQAGMKSRSQGVSWNLLLTPRAMHLIPRRLEEYPLDQEGEPNDEVGPLSLNALCFAGHLVTKSNEEIDRIRQHKGGIQSILQKVGREPVEDLLVTAASGTGDHNPGHL